MSERIDWSEVRDKNYEMRLFSWQHWFRSFEGLYESALKLEPSINDTWCNYSEHAKDKNIPLEPDYFQGVYFMLMAYGVENLFKGLIVKAKQVELRSDYLESNKLPACLKSHDLLKLAKDSGYTLKKGEEGYLRRLTRNSTWAGRYPVPTNSNEFKYEQKFSGGQKYSVAWFSPNDVSNIKVLIDNIRAFIHTV
jgi:hypothetical protein